MNDNPGVSNGLCALKNGVISNLDLETLDTIGTFGVGVVIRLNSGVVIYANNAARNLLHRNIIDNTEVLNTPDERIHIFDESGLPLPPQLFPASVCLNSSKSVENSIILIKHPAITRWLKVDCHPVLGPRATCANAVMSSFIDITAVRQGINRIAQLDRYASLFSNLVSDGIVVVKNNICIHINEIAQNLLQCSKSEFVGKEVASLLPSFPDTNGQNQEQHHENVTKAVDIIRKDGSSLPCKISYSSVRTCSDDTLTLFTLTDLSERALLEREVDEIKQRSVSAEKFIQQILINMSHEVRTPLNGIIGMFQLIGTTPDQQKIGKFAQDGLKASRRLGSLLGDLLELAKIDGQLVHIHSEPFSIDELLEATLEMFKPIAQMKGLNMRYHLDRSVPAWFEGDVIRIRQILYHLLGNACKYTENGEVALEVSSFPKNIDNLYNLLFSVRDTGPGIPAGQLEHILSPFTQLKTGDEKVQQGMGLGLYVTKRLLKLLDGTMAISSEPHHGTTVYCSLPVTKTDSHVATDEPEAPFTESRSLKILVAEDDPISQMLLKNLLTQQGHWVQCANDGKQAYRALERNRDFELLITDLQMPEMNGFELINTLRSSGNLPHYKAVPILVASAYTASKKEREALLSSGADGCLEKPVQPDKLQKAILALTDRLSPEATFPISTQPRLEKPMGWN